MPTEDTTRLLDKITDVLCVIGFIAYIGGLLFVVESLLITAVKR